MVHRFCINGCHVKSGDVIFTKDVTNSAYSLSYWALDKQLPCAVDHSVLYVGPGGLCVEAGIFGVIAFTADDRWDARTMFAERGMLDNFIAATSVLAGRGLSSGEEYAARSFVRAYALGSVGKPYNMKFSNLDNDGSLYCSQLVYLAYKMLGINLNEIAAGDGNRWSDIIVFPQKIYDSTTVIQAKYEL